jgi:hypothetical protein
MVANESDVKKIDGQYRTLLVLWIAFQPTIAFYFVLTLLQPNREQLENRVLSLVFSAISAFLVVVSFPVKKTFLTRSVDTQQVGLVSSGLVLAMALCEAAGLLALLDFFIAHDRYYFILMALAFVGVLLHFPRRTQVEAASFKNALGSQPN